MAQDEYEDCLEMARSLLGANETPNGLWEANEQVNRALRMRPEEAEAWVLKAQVLSSLEDEVAALAAADAALRIQPKSAEAQYMRGALLYDMELYEEAQKALDKSLRLVGTDDDWLLEEIYFEKAAALDALDRSDEAMAVFEEGLRRCPDSELLKTGLEPLRRERVRRTFRVLPGGRA